MDSPADEKHEICPSPKRIQAEVINSEGPYRLLYCCSKCDKEGVIQELEKGVSPNLAANDKRTPLHLASCEGCTTIVELLLEKGAEVNSTDRFGHTPLADARSFGHGEICKILEAWGGTAPVDLGTPCCLIDPEEGSLHDILRKKGRLDAPSAVAYALDIARGMNYLHQLKPHPIIHRDLKPRNILLDEAGHLKVADFGLSKMAQEKDTHGSYKMTGGTGSYRYMAPEVYRRESYRKSVDIFSFALIVQEMFEGRPSNKSESPEAVADKRAYEDSRPSLSSIYPEAIKTLLKECWHKDPELRPSFEDIIMRLEIIQENLNEKASAVEVCCKCAIL